MKARMYEYMRDGEYFIVFARTVNRARRATGAMALRLCKPSQDTPEGFLLREIYRPLNARELQFKARIYTRGN